MDDQPGNSDHGFGLGAHEPVLHETTLGDSQLTHDSATAHGLFDSLGHGAAESLGGHVEIGHLNHDFGHDGLHDGLDGLHDSVHSIGLGFGGDEHHSLHDGLHESTLHDAQHDVTHDISHDPVHDVQHHDSGLGDLFHH